MIDDVDIELGACQPNSCDFRTVEWTSVAMRSEVGVAPYLTPQTISELRNSGIAPPRSREYEAPAIRSWALEVTHPTVIPATESDPEWIASDHKARRAASKAIGLTRDREATPRESARMIDDNAGRDLSGLRDMYVVSQLRDGEWRPSVVTETHTDAYRYISDTDAYDRASGGLPIVWRVEVVAVIR